MPDIESAWRYQKAVLYMANGYDNYGNPKVDAGIDINVRWEDVTSETVDAKGNTVSIDAVVVVDREIAIGSILWKGRLEDIPGTTGVPDGDLRQVIKYSEIPDTKAQYFRRLVYCMRFKESLPTLA